MRLKTGGFLSTGDDRKDLNIIRSAKNLDDGPASSSSSTSSSSTGMKSGGVAKRQRKMNEIRKQAIEAYKDPNKRLSKNLRMHMERFKSRNKADATKMKEGGKTKSTVNKAGNYTKPTMRKALFNRIKAGGKGGAPGQWSARKAQMLAKQYKAKGGGYRG